MNSINRFMLIKLKEKYNSKETLSVSNIHLKTNLPNFPTLPKTADVFG